MKSADEVLARCMVTPRLAADRGVHHREERRRDLHEANAAEHACSCEARQVAHDPASKGDDHRGAVDLGCKRCVPDGLDGRHRLVYLAGLEHDARDRCIERQQGALQHITARGDDVGIRD
jgi:hypothetical protein